MLPVVDSHTGEALMEYHPDAPLDEASSRYATPLVFSIIIPVYQGKFVFIYNTWRDEWEVPAGHIDPGETPQQAALRELLEESCQVSADAEYLGLCVIRNVKRRDDPGVVYRCELDSLRPFVACAEASAMMLWDRQSPVEGHVDAISQWLIDQAERL